jgi:hypothetical protein
VFGLLLAALLPSAATAQQTGKVYAVAPEDGAVLGPRPLFQIAAREIDDEGLRRLELRIVLSSDRFQSETYVFDRREREAGWTPGEEGRLLYHPRQPIADGEYAWRLSLWDGARWIVSSPTYRLRIDSVPPAEVRGVRVRHDGARGALVLEWEPVTLDERGSAEYVERYRVYGHERASPFPPAAVYEIGATETPRLEIPLEPGADPPLWFFKVTAIDAAGNEAGRRTQTRY